LKFHDEIFSTYSPTSGPAHYRDPKFYTARIVGDDHFYLWRQCDYIEGWDIIHCPGSQRVVSLPHSNNLAHKLHTILQERLTNSSTTFTSLSHHPIAQNGHHRHTMLPVQPNQRARSILQIQI
jgi:hypothetical protein